MFEYKVRARHKLGWKQFSFYATTDIEEFLNRKGIEYVRNATDTIEHRQYKEIERLNNIINGMEEFFKYELEEEVRPLNSFKVSVWTICLDKLQELKGDGSNDSKRDV